MSFLDSQLRDQGLRAMVGQPTSGGRIITHIGLDSQVTAVNSLREEIDFQSPSGGEIEQDGTITFVADLTNATQDAIVSGFRFFEIDGSEVEVGNGSFQETKTLEAGNEYTINVTGIKIVLPD